jgi:peptidoglycan/xylan/chitin deacetylase (PgdA/CDA1 family)
MIFIAGLFYYSGLVRVSRWYTRHSGQSLIILNYHRMAGGDLNSHLLYLRRHYRLLPLEEALEELYTTCKGRRYKLDKRLALVLTVDDGYHDNYTHGLPLVRELEVPITIFLIPGYIESGDYFWWLESKGLVSSARVSEVTIESRTYRLNQPDEQKALAQAIDERLCYATSVAEREAFLISVRQLLAISSSVADVEEGSLPLKWNEIREMEESGYISFGAHTMHHPILSYLSDPTEVQYEVERCRIMLEQNLGHPVRTFAYPVGQLEHIGENVISVVQRAGYDWALTTINGFNTPQSNPYLLRRIEADVNQHWLVIAAEAAGLWGFISRLRWVPFIQQYIKEK